MGDIVNQTRKKTFKGFTILYKIAPKLEGSHFVLEEIRYTMLDGKVVAKMTNLYTSNSDGHALRCISPEDIELKFYKPNEYLEQKGYFNQ